jgi:hypothetical protein
MSEAAPRAEEISGTNANTLPAWIAPKTDACLDYAKGERTSVFMVTSTHHEASEKLLGRKLLI